MAPGWPMMRWSRMRKARASYSKPRVSDRSASASAPLGPDHAHWCIAARPSTVRAMASVALP
jgi:hypothetical protein